MLTNQNVLANSIEFKIKKDIINKNNMITEYYLKKYFFYYKAIYCYDNEIAYSIYSNKGYCIENIYYIKYNQLPIEVVSGFDKSQYWKYPINKIIIIKRTYITIYNIIINKRFGQKQYLYFDFNGRLISSNSSFF
ncbi:MAG: hypothetical protein IR527_00195 [Bacteroides sp.]|nr:MAG: hypothetical protein IR527_00195 [Bacteroides sp.]